MKATAVVVPAILALALSSPLIAEEPVVATVSLPHPTLLPGVPFDLEVRITNTSAKPVRVGLLAQLIVKLEDGTEVLSGTPSVLRPTLPSSPDTITTLEPHQTIVRILTWGRHSLPSYLHEPGYSGPGTYLVSVELSPGWRDEPTPIVRSSSVTLTRALESDLDRQLWERMKTGAEPWPSDGFISLRRGKELLKEILAEHPTSEYYPYALILSRESGYEQLIEAAGRFPDSPALPHLWLLAADETYRAAMGAAHRYQTLYAADLYDQAAELYNRALETKNEAVRDAAQKRRHSVVEARKAVAAVPR